jgi:hypothetical protein
MSRGLPDYGIRDYQIAIEQNDLSIFALVDSGFTFMDGRGRIIWFDNFKQGLQKWNTFTGGNGIAPTHVHYNGYYYGYYGCVIFDPVDSTGMSGMFFQQNISFGNKVGLEIYVRLTSNHGRAIFRVQESDVDGHAYTALGYIEETSGDVFITTPSGDVKVYDNPSDAYVSDHWTNFKIVGNFTTGKFYKLIIGGNSVDLSAYDMVAASTGIKGRVYIDLRIEGKVGKTGQMYIGGVLVNVDEP